MTIFGALAIGLPVLILTSVLVGGMRKKESFSFTTTAEIDGTLDEVWLVLSNPDAYVDLQPLIKKVQKEPMMKNATRHVVRVTEKVPLVYGLISTDVESRVEIEPKPFQTARRTISMKIKNSGFEGSSLWVLRETTGQDEYGNPKKFVHAEETFSGRCAWLLSGWVERVARKAHRELFVRLGARVGDKATFQSIHMEKVF